MASASSKPWKNVKELVAYGKANPGKLNYALSSPAITLPMLAFLQGYGIEAVAISYKGGVPAVQSVMAGETDVGFMPESYAITAADRARALAVTSPQRLPAFPDAPTFAELGHLKIPGNSYSLNAPAGTPPAVIAKLQSAIATVLKQPQLRTQLERSHLRVVNETQEVAAQGLADRIKIYGDIVKRAGITPQ